MAISNIQETLLMYTKQKSMLNAKLSDVMFQIMNATRENAELQQKYNDKEQYYYYEYYDSEDHTVYEEVMEQLTKEHEYELANLESWESQLELDKNNYETRLNEVTAYESSWTKLLQTNIKNDFSYGGTSQ